ncbi:MAG: sigma-70 family RNA polymerase sigma factor [Ruminococcaceae bacterium]|nr:sigma-70 family RNA polymerase sigma factor [Oscillospiraceae bacterium]
MIKTEDSKIIELYFKRSESAIEESRKRYGKYCNTVAFNILHSAEESEECVSDTWLRAWNSIPPNKPQKLSVFLGSITRNLAIDRYRKSNTGKRGNGEAAVCLEELAECISDENMNSFTDTVSLKDALNRFLKELSGSARDIFMLRYWYMLPVKEVAKRCGVKEGTVRMSLSRTRQALKDFLENEGYEP